ncbi:radical SAM protein [Salinarimonas sp.]|uniref:radical SAM protein n=1 Tax=Salinarimonas sp. TaxID=2766526 RepID=UPI0032D904B8
MSDSDVLSYAELKVDVLCNGVAYAEGFLPAYAARPDWIGKRRAYGNSDLAQFGTTKVPQEFRLKDGTICSANFVPSSPYQLSISEEGPYLLDTRKDTAFQIRFPLEPKAYAFDLSNGRPFKEVATYYGETTLGFFNPGHCYYFDEGTQCRFCSLGPAREETDHVMKVLPGLAQEAVRLSAELDGDRVVRTLINGGNARNYDRGFGNQTRLAVALAEVNREFLGGRLTNHLIAMPPKDFELMKPLHGVVDRLAMSLEIYDPELFAEICPGKHRDFGRDRFLDAYSAAVGVLGPGRVYVGLVAGLEPVESVVEAMWRFGEQGVVPAIAVFHPGRGSIFETYPRPRPEDILAIGREMQKVYRKFDFTAFIESSGRNSIDTEAQRYAF